MNDTTNNNNDINELQTLVNINNYLIILGIGLNIIFYIYYLIRKFIKKCKKNNINKNEQPASLPDVKKNELNLIKQIVSHNVLVYDEKNKG